MSHARPQTPGRLACKIIFDRKITNYPVSICYWQDKFNQGTKETLP